MKIVLADDDKLAQKLYSNLLEQEGHEVVLASDGIEAVRKTYEENPNLLILDIMMPKMNGYQVCRLLRNNIKYKDLPIMIVTAKNKKMDIFWGHECGADYYLIKPFNEKEFSNKIKDIISKLNKQNNP